TISDDMIASYQNQRLFTGSPAFTHNDQILRRKFCIPFELINLSVVFQILFLGSSAFPVNKVIPFQGGLQGLQLPFGIKVILKIPKPPQVLLKRFDLEIFKPVGFSLKNDPVRFIRHEKKLSKFSNQGRTSH